MEPTASWKCMKNVKSYDIGQLGSTNSCQELFSNREPVILNNVHIGPCTALWTPEYLAHTVGDKEVKVHVCPHENMNFLDKNFIYKTMKFSTLVKRATKIESDYYISPDEVYYYRALGTDPRGRDIAKLDDHFPEISKDFEKPFFLDDCEIFSSVLRISSSRARLWTHYDIMDNVLIQIVGSKDIILFPPNNALDLYLEKDKSKVVDLDNIDFECYPKMKNTTPYKAFLSPGDILFLPALWFHNVVSHEFSVAVNVFWKHLDDEFYDKKDPYGNHDLLPATNAMVKVDSAIKILSKLPPVYKDFYGRRLISKLENLLINE